MKKGLLIILSCAIAGCLCLIFTGASSENKVYMKEVIDGINVGLIPISSSDYAERMGESIDSEGGYNDYEYFIMKIYEQDSSVNPIRKNLNSEQEFGDRINYLSSAITRDLSLIRGSDTVQCAISHWERTYDLRKDITLNLMFEREKGATSNKFIWNDRLFSGTPVKIKLN